MGRFAFVPKLLTEFKQHVWVMLLSVCALGTEAKVSGRSRADPCCTRIASLPGAFASPQQCEAGHSACRCPSSDVLLLKAKVGQRLCDTKNNALFKKCFSLHSYSSVSVPGNLFATRTSVSTSVSNSVMSGVSWNLDGRQEVYNNHTGYSKFLIIGWKI